jgi:hypothetical protein
MDDRGCWRDSVFVERLWKSIKYEEVCLRAYEAVNAASGVIWSSITAAGRIVRLTPRRRMHLEPPLRAIPPQRLFAERAMPVWQRPRILHLAAACTVAMAATRPKGLHGEEARLAPAQRKRVDQ